MTETVNFYHDAFGYRLLFNLHISENCALSYIGHANGGRNGSGYQTATEMSQERNNREGLIELIELKHWDIPSELKVVNTFSHMGMIVPNLTVTYQELKSMNANILKVPDETFELDEWFALGSRL